MLSERIISHLHMRRLDERMGYTDKIPLRLAVAIVNKFFNIHERNVSKDMWHEEFTVKPGTPELPEKVVVDIYHGTDDDEHFNAGIGDDDSLVINDEALYAMSDAQAVSTVYHELVHIRQYHKQKEGERGVVDDKKDPWLASQQGKFEYDYDNEGLHIMALLVNPENESRLSQVYQEARMKLKTSPAMRGMNNKEAVMSLAFMTDNSSRMDELSFCFSKVERQIQNGDVDKLAPFVKAYSVLKNGNQDKFEKYDDKTIVQQARKIMALYQKMFGIYKRKVYNALFQAVTERDE